MVLGIVGTCLSFMPFINNGAFIMGALALIFGIIALLKKAFVGSAVAAAILGILAIVITVVVQASMVKAVEEATDSINAAVDEFNSEMEGFNNELEQSMKEYSYDYE